jgi:hypothetical protein
MRQRLVVVSEHCATSVTPLEILKINTMKKFRIVIDGQESIVEADDYKIICVSSNYYCAHFYKGIREESVASFTFDNQTLIKIKCLEN